MTHSVYDLAVEVVLYLIAFQRRVEAGEEPGYESTRAEVIKLLSDLDQRSHTEPGLWDLWQRARIPLVYLVDEVMILNADWRHTNTWSDECLEVQLLGHPAALRGEKFYEECDAALSELETAERHERHDLRARADIVMVFYVAMQCGFKGKYALDTQGWYEYKGHVFSKLPAYVQTRMKELFPEADKHTILRDPNYEPVMRLLYVLIGFTVLLTAWLVTSGVYWNEQVGELAKHAQGVNVPTSAPTDPG